MPEQTNPTRRLYDILNEALSSQGTFEQAQTSYGFLSKFLGLGPKDDFFDALSRIFSIIDSYENFVRGNSAIPAEKQTRHLEQVRQIKIAFFNAKQAGWSGLSHNIDHNLLTSLQWAADDMELYWYEEVISEENLADLQSDVEDVINKVVDSDLEDVLKSVLFEGLESVRNALLNYQMFGAEGIRQSLDRNFALPFRYSDEFIRASESDQGKNVVSAFFEFLKKLNIAASTGLKVKQISGPAIDRMLESGG